MERTYLVQRLCKPHGKSLHSSLSFGGGLKNGGLSDEAMKILSEIFSFDYMGSSEFEWGAVPASFKAIATNIGNYSTFQTEINNIPIHIIGPSEHQTEIIKTIHQLSKRELLLKERSRLDWAVGLDKYAPKRMCDYIGWLELDNNYLFFTDKTAFTKTCELFGIKTNQQNETPHTPPIKSTEH
jgi:hypothetical protein